ncbi:MAG: TetR/AcrR family transcriptional regulator [Rhodothermales bacterium]
MDITLTRRERERLARREAMLEAAAQVFAEHGFDNATLDEIALRAEFGKGTLYNYFSSKEELLLAVIERLYAQFYTTIEEGFAIERVSTEPFERILRDFLLTCFTYFTDHRHLFLLLMREAQRLFFSGNPEHASFFVNHRNRVMTLMCEALQHGIDCGAIRNMDTHAMALMILASIKHFQMELIVPDDTEVSCSMGTFQSPEYAADALLPLLLHGLAVPPPPSSN